MIHRALLVKKEKSVLQNITFIGDHTLSCINLLYRIIEHLLQSALDFY